MKNIVLSGRENQVTVKNDSKHAITCDTASLAGSVSQRACVFCGSRVVLYPIADAIHIVHGPIGCAAYTWDIRGSLSSGPEYHRLSFSTDLQETDVIYGGETKLEKSITELVDKYKPNALFVYSTCIVGIIGDDLSMVCKKSFKKHGIPVIPVDSEGFKGTKKDGYKAACNALFSLIGSDNETKVPNNGVNILGEFNLAGEAWMIKEYYKQVGIPIISVMTGDGRVHEIQRAHRAKLNVVQCSGSMIALAEKMKKEYGIPYIRVSYFGVEDTSKALYDVADFFKNSEMQKNVSKLLTKKIDELTLKIEKFRKDLKGRKAAIYVGGAFKAFSLIKALRMVEMKVVLVGSQTGSKEDYDVLQDMCDKDTVIVDDSNPLELSHFILEKKAEVFIGGVKERYMALKLGVGFCDHNHERKNALAGFEGMYNFIKELHCSVMSPVWKFHPARKKGECSE